MDTTENKNVKTFVRCVRRYFERTTGGKEVIIEPPFLLASEGDVVLSYSGVIGVSGEHKGMIIVSCSAQMLDELLQHIGEPDPTIELRQDMVGEMANTISGNLREDFGANFLISVPLVIRGNAGFQFPKTTKNLVIPLRWKELTSYVIVCLE